MDRASTGDNNNVLSCGIPLDISSYVGKKQEINMKQIKLILILLLPVCIINCSAQSFSPKGLSQIFERTKEKSIIGLGEAEHFRKGYYSSKCDLVKHLVQEGSINTIALEASTSVTSILNDYINGRCSRETK